MYPNFINCFLPSQGNGRHSFHCSWKRVSRCFWQPSITWYVTCIQLPSQLISWFFLTFFYVCLLIYWWQEFLNNHFFQSMLYLRQQNWVVWCIIVPKIKEFYETLRKNMELSFPEISYAYLSICKSCVSSVLELAAIYIFILLA